MTESFEGASSPAAKQALEELQKDGHSIAEDGETDIDENDGTVIEEEAKEEEDLKPELKKDPEEDPKPEEGKDKKTEREVSFVPAYKLKVAEAQKANAEKELAEAKSKIEELSKQKGDLTKEDKKDLNDAVKTLSEKYGADPDLINDLKDLISSQLALPADVIEKLKGIDDLKKFKDDSSEKVKIQEQEKSYTSEFETDILPLLKGENPKITEDTILKIKEDLKSLAFSEGYNVLPLKKVFLAERESLNLPVAVVGRKTTESGRSGAVRSDTGIDFDNMSEDQFRNLSPEDTIKFTQHQKLKSGSGWKR